jgi:hypothetical protein
VMEMVRRGATNYSAIHFESFQAGYTDIMDDISRVMSSQPNGCTQLYVYR